MNKLVNCGMKNTAEVGEKLFCGSYLCLKSALEISSKIFEIVSRGLFSLRLPNHSCEINNAPTTGLLLPFCKVKVLVLVMYEVIIQSEFIFVFSSVSFLVNFTM